MGKTVTRKTGADSWWNSLPFPMSSSSSSSCASSSEGGSSSSSSSSSEFHPLKTLALCVVVLKPHGLTIAQEQSVAEFPNLPPSASIVEAGVGQAVTVSGTGAYPCPTIPTIIEAAYPLIPKSALVFNFLQASAQTGLVRAKLRGGYGDMSFLFDPCTGTFTVSVVRHAGLIFKVVDSTSFLTTQPLPIVVLRLQQDCGPAATLVYPFPDGTALL